MLEYGLSLGMVLLADFYGYITGTLEFVNIGIYVLNVNRPGEELNRG